MKLVSASAACITLITTALCAGQARAGAPLPLTRLRLYETGVGYFERSGKLSTSGNVGLPVPTGHLDDALKTLVVLSTDTRTEVSGIEFGSSLSRSMGRALAGLSPDADAPLGFLELLTSLKGESVEIASRQGNFKGRIIDVVAAQASAIEECVVVRTVQDKASNAGARADGHDEQRTDPPCVLTKQPAVLLLTERAEIRRFTLSELTSVRPTNPAFSVRLVSALDALSARGAQTQKALNVLASAGKPLSVGYVAETPVWRSTYRLVLDANEPRGALQGWALVHNDTDEDWKRVQVELVNGRPDSFLFPLAAPRYARRELVTPEAELQTVPQLLDATVDSMWGGESGESFGVGGLGLSGTGEGGGGRGEGIGLGSIGTLGHGAGASGASASSLLSVGNLAALSKAEGIESGALFRYTLKSAVDLRAHGSVLLPFVSNGVSAKRIAWFKGPDSEARSAVHFKNDTRQTLPPGTIAFFDDGGFAGESAITRMKPAEARILSFGYDLDVELLLNHQRKHDEIKLLSFAQDSLVVHLIRHHAIDYRVTNKSASARSVYLSLPFVSNSRVSGADALEFDEQTREALAVFGVGAKQVRERKLNVQEGLSESTGFVKLRSWYLRELARLPSLPAKQRKILAQAAELLLDSELRRGALPKRQGELRQVEIDIKRLRDSVRALAASRIRGAEEIVKRLLLSEDRGRALRQRIAELKSESAQRLARARLTLAALPG